jgi:1-acyl-sn-glycerol-3-phosphate acyltransferase
MALKKFWVGMAVLLVYKSLTSLMRLAVFAFAKWDVSGVEHIPEDQGCVLVSNHVHIIDPPLLAASSPSRRLRTMAKQELFSLPLIGWIFTAYGAYSVKRNGRDLRALRESLRLISTGEAILLFVEGTRSGGGPLQTGHGGAALIALKSGKPVIPVSIQGSNIKFPHIFFQWIVRRRPHIVVRFGPPVDLLGIETDTSGVSQATDQIMYAIADLLPLDLRGSYGRPSD